MDTEPDPQITVIHTVEPNKTCKRLVEEYYNHRRITRLDKITGVLNINGKGTLCYNCYIEIITEHYDE